jgi:hypothetical protein
MLAFLGAFIAGGLLGVLIVVLVAIFRKDEK